MTPPPPPRDEVLTSFSLADVMFYCNDATSGGGKVLSVARLEMAYRIKGSKLSYLEDNYHIWQHWEGGRPMTVLSTVRACARRWNVREIPFPKLVRAQKLVCEGPREPQISDEAKSQTFLESLPDAFFRSQKEDMSGEKRTSGHPIYGYILGPNLKTRQVATVL